MATHMDRGIISRSSCLRVGGEGILDHAHLGAVAVGYHHRVPGFYQIRNGLGGLLYRQHLFRQIFAQRVAARAMTIRLPILLLLILDNF